MATAERLHELTQALDAELQSSWDPKDDEVRLEFRKGEPPCWHVKQTFITVAGQAPAATVVP